MSLISNLSVKQRLLVLLIIIVGVAGIGVLAVQGTGAGNATDTAVADPQPPHVQIARMFDLASQNRTLALSAVQYDPRNSEAQFITQPFSSLRPQLDRNLAELDRIKQGYQASPMSENEQRLFAQVAADHQTFVDSGVIAVFDAVENERFDEAKHLFYRELDPSFERFRLGIESLKKLHPEVAPQG